MSQSMTSLGSLAGVRLHRPGAIAVYMVVGGGLGLFLYGQNLSRRGHSMRGRTICLLAAMAMLGAIFLGAAGSRLSGMGLLGILIAIALYKREDDAYRKSIAQGARPTRWWPPALALLGMMAALLVIQRLFFPEVWVQEN